MLAVMVGPAYAVIRYADRGSWVLIVAVVPAVVSLLVVEPPVADDLGAAAAGVHRDATTR